MTEQIKQRQPLIELKDVTKTYHDGKRKDVFAVSNFNLTLYEGETLGLVGESGCGKSTIGNMLVHLFTPDEGSILFRGQDIASMNERQFHPLRKEIQMVFQDPYSSLNPRKKIGWLLEEPLKIHRKNMKKEERKAKVEEILKEVGLDAEYANRYPKELSGGQRQALTLLMATLKKPRLLLLDEHTAALDPKTAAKVLSITEELVAEGNLTTMMVTHNMKDAITIGNRLIMMNNGIIYDVSGEEKKNLTVEDLLKKFSEASGEELVNDRMMLAK